MEPLSETRVGSGQGQDFLSIRTVDPQAVERFDILLIAMDLQIMRPARYILQLTERDRVIHAVLSHMAIGGPFAADYGQQPGVVDMDGVVAGER
jgi:hypothetical protein